MESTTKNLLPTIDFIKNFQQEVILSKLPFDDRSARLSIDERTIRLNFELTTNEAYKSYNLIFLDSFIITNSNGNNYTVPHHNGVINGHLNLCLQDDDLNNYNISISHLMDNRWNEQENYYYRLILPVDNIFWIRDIQTYCYQTEAATYSGLIEIAFPQGTIQIYPIYMGEKKYIAIESGMECTYEMMQKFLYAISLSLGLVTSIIPFDYSYIIASDSEDFSKDLLCGFTQLRPTIKGQYRPFTTNMYSIKDCLKRNGAEYALSQLYDNNTFLSKLQPQLQMNEFENIVKMLYNNENLARATLILIEASTISLDYQGAICAVALETICSALEPPKNKYYMNNEEWQRKVVPAFKELTEKLKANETISEEHATGIKNKLNNLNTLANKDWLLLPFHKRGYNPSKCEKDIINNRNRFLHGHILGHCHEESYQAIMYSSLELQKLCTILLFKESGFHGFIVNNAVLLGLEKALTNKEPILVAI